MTDPKSESFPSKQALKAVLPSDEQLMARVSSGQLDSAGILFERYQHKLYNFFLRLSGDGSLSEDHTQSVFERLLRYRKTYRERMPFKAWLYQIARHVRIDHVNKQSLVNVGPELAAGIPDESDTPNLSMERREEVAGLLKALSKLPEEQREILVLTRFQELKYREVSQMIGITEGAVKVRVHRAMSALRIIFDKQQGI